MPIALMEERLNSTALLSCHTAGDWGELCEEDCRENAFALKEGFRILSVYTLSRTRVNSGSAATLALTIIAPEEC